MGSDLDLTQPAWFPESGLILQAADRGPKGETPKGSTVRCAPMVASAQAAIEALSRMVAVARNRAGVVGAWTSQTMRNIILRMPLASLHLLAQLPFYTGPDLAEGKSGTYLNVRF
jgi:hypothetical protein